MRIFGGVLILIGLLVCLTIVGIPFGIILILVGAAMCIFGGSRRTVINNVVQVSAAPGATHGVNLGPDAIPHVRQPTFDGTPIVEETRREALPPR